MGMGHDATRADEYRGLFRDVYNDAVRFAMRRADPTDADEAVATAMTIAWRRFDRAPATLDARRAWVFGIVRKTLLNERRGRARRAALEVRVASHAELVHRDDHSAVDLRADLEAAWSTLSAQQQEALGLAVFEQLDASHAAKALGILPGTYRVRLSRARDALRVALDERSSAAAHTASRIAQEAS
ncbi:RNA polymerase sigma factor [Agrococcus jejuensis]|uniref:RNA polymerase sigma factor n=1 Tax=Agrococcus jejuensis TaxID=399736 RepID=UPI0011A4C0CC|nr:sigma-70 family RNA polymerase sigma factor [Agrococcus jejuensis]